jgi:hypothetical protein
MFIKWSYSQPLAEWLDNTFKKNVQWTWLGEEHILSYNQICTTVMVYANGRT